MSDTPETDAEDYRICEAWSSTANDYYTMLEFARKLERERDEWKEVAEGSLLGAIKERDEAVRSCQIWQQGHSKIVADRDYWRAEAERWRDLSLEHDDEVVIDDQTAPYGEWWEVQK
jgi:hypothetical protein